MLLKGEEMYTILAVEDDPYYQKYYEKLFSKKYNYIGLFNGENTNEVIREHQPDLLILDMDIPGKTGRSIVIDVKKIDKEIPIIIVSSKSGIKSDPEIELSSQIQRFFEKPAKLQEIAVAVDRILGNPKYISRPISWVGKNVMGCKVEELIGTGGCGSVYKGKKFDRTLALKFVNIRDSNILERFRRELLSMAKIQHENIIEFYDAKEVMPGVCCVVMNYFEGETLYEHLEDEPFPLEEAIFVIREIAKGLQVAHDKGIIHRDIKPTNIMYNKNTRKVKIIDFGVTKDLNELRITEEGQAIGTPMFMSPEQCQGYSVDHRCDIYSLGAVFYNALVGGPPFLGESVFSVMRAQVEDDIIWPFEEDIPNGIKNLVEQMMKKKVEDRISSMNEFLGMLELQVHSGELFG